MEDMKGRPLWNMPEPTGHVNHKKWSLSKETGERIAEIVKVPVYRGTSAEYARWVRGQIKRSQRKAAEEKARLDAENTAMQEAEAALEDLVLNPGGHDV
jgi:hypothetical protein